MDSRIIELPGALPFRPSNEQALYIEKEYDANMNAFITEHYEDISDYFHSKRVDFCYMPLHFEGRAVDMVLYHNPCADTSKIPEVSITTCELVSALFGDNVPEDLKPSVIIYLKYESTPDISRFMMVELDLEKMEDVFKPKPEPVKKTFWQRVFGTTPIQSYNYNPNYFESVASELSHALHNPNETAFYREVNWLDESWVRYLKENNDLLAEIDLKIHQLQNQGVDGLMLKKLLCQMVDDSRKLSRLVVTADYRILLPDYNNMEIRMEPVNKAVYLLFLRHKEGIRLKEMPDYKEELTEIYSKLSDDSKDKQKATIESLCDPLSNSINEKISRIRKAFVAHFDDELARAYYITGGRGEAKAVSIDNEMISVMLLL